MDAAYQALIGGMGSLKVNRDDLGYAFFFHGNSEQGIGKFHAAFIVCDHYNL
jgi:hypothetical protein